MSMSFKPFQAYYRWCLAAQPGIAKTMEIKVHLFMAIALITSVLMWSYSWASYAYVANPLLNFMGFFYAAVHLSALAVFRATGSLKVACNTMLVPGLLFQVHFSFVTGGFFTTTIVWVGILPLIAGVLTNIRHTLIWSGFAIASILGMMALELEGYPFAHAMSDRGRFVIQLFVLFGMIALNSGFTIFLLLLEQSMVARQAQKTLEKQNFLRVLAHDIANPLNIISTGTQILLQHGPTDEDKRQKMLSMVERASQLISDILSTVRQLEASESGKLKIELKPCALLPIIEQCLEHFKSQLTSKNIQVDLHCPPDLCVLTHATLMQNQVLSNILSNAIKFSPSGGHIVIVCEESGSSGLIHIKDQGEGIPPSLLTDLFSPSAVTHRPGTWGEGGTGFGMPIAWKFAQLLTGKIDVESPCREAGIAVGGTKFSIVLPLAKNSAVSESTQGLNNSTFLRSA